MDFLEFDDLGITGLAACVPKRVVRNADLTAYYSPAEIDKFVKTTGVVERRVRKLKLKPERVPCGIARFGNTSSTSIPLAIVTGLKDQLSVPRRVLLSAFGVGTSWASAIVNLGGTVRISELVEV